MFFVVKYVNRTDTMRNRQVILKLRGLSVITGYSIVDKAINVEFINRKGNMYNNHMIYQN